MRPRLICPLFAILSVVTLAGAQDRAARPGDFRTETPLKVGDPAPDFQLARLHGDGWVQLSNFKGSRPVALIFGSYT